MPSSPGWIKYAISATISAMASETAWTISLRNTRRAPVIRPRLVGPAPTPNHHLRSFAESTRGRGGEVTVTRGERGGVGSFGVLARGTNGSFRGPREHPALETRLTVAWGGGKSV